MMKGKAKEQIKTVQAQHEAILASTNSLKEQYVKEMEVSRSVALRGIRERSMLAARTLAIARTVTSWYLLCTFRRGGKW